MPQKSNQASEGVKNDLNKLVVTTTSSKIYIGCEDYLIKNIQEWSQQ